MKFSSKQGFTLPLVFAIFSIYLLFTSFYLSVYSLKLKSLDALNHVYDNAMNKILEERKNTNDE